MHRIAGLLFLRNRQRGFCVPGAPPIVLNLQTREPRSRIAA
jgi:hypothetical protein